MRRVLLDTSAYSLLFKGHSAVAEVARIADQVCLNPIVLGELRTGFQLGNRTAENEKDLLDYLDLSRVRILPVDEETSRRYALLKSHLKRQGTPVAANDLWIASTALQHGLELVTADSDFSRIPGLLLTLL